MKSNSFTPINRLLMGPGPSNVHPKVLKALARPTIGHLDPQFINLMDEIKSLLKYAFQTKNEVTFAVSGPGSVGMETCLVNLVEPGDKVIVPPPKTVEMAAERVGGDFECADWYLCKKTL